MRRKKSFRCWRKVIKRFDSNHSLSALENNFSLSSKKNLCHDSVDRWIDLLMMIYVHIRFLKCFQHPWDRLYKVVNKIVCRLIDSFVSNCEHHLVPSVNSFLMAVRWITDCLMIYCVICASSHVDAGKWFCVSFSESFKRLWRSCSNEEPFIHILNDGSSCRKM